MWYKATACLLCVFLTLAQAAYAQNKVVAAPVTPVSATPLPAVPKIPAPQTPAVAPKKITAKDFMEFYAPYQNSKGQVLTDANRSGKELQVWVSEKIADFFSLDPKSATLTLNQARPFFTPDAYNAYLLALGSLPYAEQIRNGQVRISTIVETLPALLSSGSVGGRYIWVYEIKALITASPVRSNIPVKGPETVQATYRLQLARVEGAPQPHEVLINVWQIIATGQPAVTQEKPAQSPDTPVVVN